MKIAIACDHAGFALKEEVKKYLIEEGFESVDLGTSSTESVDYPVFGKKCAVEVASGRADRGIVICGTGIGISIAANKVKGIRCALCADSDLASISRLHNDANMLALGGRKTDIKTARDIIKVWLNTDFEGGRHQARVDLLNDM